MNGNFIILDTTAYRSPSWPERRLIKSAIGLNHHAGGATRDLRSRFGAPGPVVVGVAAD
jgi:hypothetical protein